MYILRSMFVISGSSLYPGFIIVRFNCTSIGFLYMVTSTSKVRTVLKDTSEMQPPPLKRQHHSVSFEISHIDVHMHK